MASFYADEQFPFNRNWEQFASRIDEAVKVEGSLQGKLIRVVRPVR
jgi:hypothetical protein